MASHDDPWWTEQWSDPWSVALGTPRKPALHAPPVNRIHSAPTVHHTTDSSASTSTDPLSSSKLCDFRHASPDPHVHSGHSAPSAHSNADQAASSEGDPLSTYKGLPPASTVEHSAVNLRFPRAVDHRSSDDFFDDGGTLDVLSVELRSFEGDVYDLVAKERVMSRALVYKLRQRVASLMGLHIWQVELLVGDRVLDDRKRLEDETGCTRGDIWVKVRVKRDLSSHVIEYGRFELDADIFSLDGGRVSKPLAFAKLGQVDFPPFQGIQINMMPFIIGDKGSVPEEYQHYWYMLEACTSCGKVGQVGYITIHESFVRKGSTQRRAGLHIETPGAFLGVANGECKIDFLPFVWDCGRLESKDLHGGLCMASNVANSCRVWNAQIRDPEKVVSNLANSTQHFADIDHLRNELGDAYTLEAGDLVWLTDTTPHESLAVPEDTHRQFFRFVSSNVSVWYEGHSTRNRLGITPDPKFTLIIRTVADLPTAAIAMPVEDSQFTGPPSSSGGMHDYTPIYGRAIAKFEAADHGDEYIDLNTNALVSRFSLEGGWAWGWCSHASNTGWFPDNFCKWHEDLAPNGIFFEQSSVGVPDEFVSPDDSVSQVEVVDSTHSYPSKSQMSIRSQISDTCSSVISVVDPENTTGTRCFLAEALFKTPENRFVLARELTEGCLICGANGMNMRVKSIRIHEGQDQEFVHLQSDAASLIVTTSHRVLVQRRHKAQTLRAGALQPGESVLCTGNRVEQLTDATVFRDSLAVVEIVFDPDEAVEAFSHPADVILSKGHGVAKTLRRSKGLRLDGRSMPSTDFGDGW